MTENNEASIFKLLPTPDARLATWANVGRAAAAVMAAGAAAYGAKKLYDHYSKDEIKQYYETLAVLRDEEIPERSRLLMACLGVFVVHHHVQNMPPVTKDHLWRIGQRLDPDIPNKSKWEAIQIMVGLHPTIKRTPLLIRLKYPRSSAVKPSGALIYGLESGDAELVHAQEIVAARLSPVDGM